MAIKIDKKTPGDVTCGFCKGTGKHDGETCIVCGGGGTVNVIDTSKRCQWCKGNGFLMKGIPCTNCGGTGYTRPVAKTRLF